MNQIKWDDMRWCPECHGVGYFAGQFDERRQNRHCWFCNGGRVVPKEGVPGSMGLAGVPVPPEITSGNGAEHHYDAVDPNPMPKNES